MDEKGDAVLIAMPLKDADKAAKMRTRTRQAAGAAGHGLAAAGDRLSAVPRAASSRHAERENNRSDDDGEELPRGQPRRLRPADHARSAQLALQAVLDSKHSIDADLADFQPWLSENDIAAVATRRLIHMPIGKGLHEVHLQKKFLSDVNANSSALQVCDDDGRVRDDPDHDRRERHPAAVGRADPLPARCSSLVRTQVGHGRQDPTRCRPRSSRPRPVRSPVCPAVRSSFAMGFPGLRDAMQPLMDLEVQDALS